MGDCGCPGQLPGMDVQCEYIGVLAKESLSLN